MHFIKLIIVSFFVYIIFPNISSATQPSSSFTSSEHISAGNNVKLYFSNTNPGQKAIKLHLPNQLEVSYGEILSLVDLYGIVGYPISQGTSQEEKRLRFLNAFHSLAYKNEVLPEANKILEIMYQEQNALDEGIKNGESYDEIYQKLGFSIERQMNCLTGGGCQENTWFLYAGRSLSLSKEDFDHFGNNALLTYKIGHQLALEEAILGYKHHDQRHLEIAYAMNAFASHFLSDRFAAGHMRTPRIELPLHVTPQVVGSLLVKYMHDEENKFGLHVHNKNGNHWVAYGDKNYFKDTSKIHREMHERALQISADEIFTAFQTGLFPKENIDSLIPVPDEINNASNVDLSPLFYWDLTTQKMLRRNNMTNVYDRNWTDNWWGWSTLIALKKERGLSKLAEGTLATSNHATIAIEKNLITDAEIKAFVQTK